MCTTNLLSSFIDRISAHSGTDMAGRIIIIKHEAVPDCGSYEVQFPDGRPSRYFYFEDLPGRRLRAVEAFTREEALEQARTFARVEQDRIDKPDDNVNG